MRANAAGVEPVSTTSEPIIPAGIPDWALVVVAGLVLVVVFWILARTMRMLASVLAIVVIGAASWLAWQYLFG